MSIIGNKTQINEGIWIVENFLNDLEINILLTEAKKEKNWDPLDGSGHWQGNIFHTSKIESLSDTMSDIEIKLSNLINTSEYKLNTEDTILRRKTDGSELSMNLHHDKDTPFTKFGVVIYLNDDFEGGEIEYPYLNISIKPKPGLLICHSAEKKYSHQINKMISGTRYMMTRFVFENKWFDYSDSERIKLWGDYYLNNLNK